MWNVKAYKKALQEIKESGKFNGKQIKTKEEIYKELAQLIYQQYDTIKSWTRPTSGGPGDDSIRMDLEKALGVPEGAFVTNTDSKRGETMQAVRLTDFNKNAILRCYELMKDYLHDDQMEHEECFSQMFTEIEKQRIAIPGEVYEKICQFIDETLAPIVYEREETYPECYSDDIGFYNEEGIWEVRDEESLKRMCMAFIMRTMEIEQALDKFAMDELHPLLV